MSQGPFLLEATLLFDQMAESVAGYERDGTIVYANPLTCRLFGKTATELVGQNLWQLFPEARDGTFHRVFSRVAATGAQEQFENYYAPWDRWYDNSVYVAGDKVWVLARDITEHKRAAGRLDILAQASRTFAEAAADPTTSFDAVARAVAELLRDGCVIRLLSADRESFESPVGVWDAEPAVRELLRRAPPVSSREGAGDVVFAQGKSLILSGLDPRAIAERIAPPEQIEFATQLAIHSVMIVPLKVHGRVVGLLSCIRRNQATTQPFEVEDLKLAEELADRAALVVDGSRALHLAKLGEERLRYLVEGSPYAVAMLDRGMSYIFASRRWLTDFRLSLTQDEIRGRNHYQLFPELPAAWRDVHRRCLLGEVVTNEAEEFRRADGRVEWLRWEVRPWTDDRGNVGGILIFSEDIGAKKRADDDLKRWRHVFQNAAWGMSLATPDNRFIEVNRAFAEMHGTETGEWVGRSLLDMFDDESRARLPKLAERVHETGHIEYESTHKRKDGSLFPVLTQVTAFKDDDGQVVFRAANFQDITLRKRYEAELKSAIALRDEFLAIAAHELRTPLTALSLQLESLALAFARGPLDDASAASRKVTKATAQTQRLKFLVNTLLDVSRIATGHLQLDMAEVELAGLIQEVCDRLEETAARAGSRIRVDASPTDRVLGDRLRLDQALTNLVSNAIKYGAGKDILVSSASEASRVRIDVQDDGIGVSARDAERIFGRFERAVSSEHYGGLGLGLFIANQVVTAHGGSIELRSQEGQGTTFTVWLPIASRVRE